MSDTSLQEPIASGEKPSATSPWRRWSRAFDAHNFATNTSFTRAIWMIYLAGQGYNPLTLGLLEMLFHVARFATEVPTGIFADMLGRRKSLIVYCALSLYGHYSLYHALAPGALATLAQTLLLRKIRHTNLEEGK